MNRNIIEMGKRLVQSGINPLKFFRYVKSLPAYFCDIARFRNLSPPPVTGKVQETKFQWGTLFPCLVDKYESAGVGMGDYFNQDLLVARRIFKNSPLKHVDVGSRFDGFVTHVASFREITVLDIRPQSVNIPNITFLQCDFMKPLSDSLLESTDSLSCLHALEHFGLGRYGDPLNCNGHLLGLENLYKMLSPGGKLYFSVPMGLPQRIEFNAHRVFSVKYLLEQFSGKYNIDFFSYVDDNGILHENTALEQSGIETSFGCFYGCGIFEMTKI